MIAEDWMLLTIYADDEDVVAQVEDEEEDEEEEDEDLDDDEDEEDDDADEDEDEDDDVGTDERGKEILEASTPKPDASEDRSAPPDDATADRASTKPRKPSLDIKQIEELEDDAPGG